MLCAILIPTRKRVGRFWKTFKSIHDTAAAKDYQVVARIDDDDTESIKGIKPNARLKVVRGPRGRGYPEINLFYTEMAKAVPAKWIWIMNDDATVEGEGWDTKLAAIDKEKVIVQPETMGWGPSQYKFAEGGAFPIVLNGCWEQFGLKDIPDPADAALDDLLRVRNGWQTEWLAGVKVQHDRDEAPALDLHRKL